MNLLQSMGVLLSPKTAFQIVHKACEETLGQEVKDFDIIFIPEKPDHHAKIDFVIYDFHDKLSGVTHKRKRLKYGNNDFLAVIKNLVGEKLIQAKKDELDYALFSYSRQAMDIYINKNGVKSIKSIKL